jgi:hypothetical protein
MAYLRMRGPYPLTDDTIDQKITENAPGNFAIGEEGSSGAFLVGYVGRSDSDIKASLKAWSAKVKSKTSFKFSYAPSSHAAYEKECENFHDFSPPGRHVHPFPPRGETWRCPRCGASGGQ